VLWWPPDQQRVRAFSFRDIYAICAAPVKKRKLEAKETASSKPEEAKVWLVTTETLHDGYSRERESKVVGVYSTKDVAIQNAKVAFTNLDNCDSCFDDDGKFDPEEWEDYTDNSDKLGEKGGVLYEVNGAEGEEYKVMVEKINMNKSVKDKSVKGQGWGVVEESDDEESDDDC
jgi:hypothetical protein